MKNAVRLIGCMVLCAGMVLSQVEAGVKKAVMIIAQNDFRDEELFETKKVLESGGVSVTVASTTRGPVKGMLGGTATPDMLVKDVSMDDYDALIFVGGSGAQQYWADATAHALANKAYASGKVTAAICIAPVTLAKAGLLKGRKATVWSSEAGQLAALGAQYTGSDVEQDGLIITASGPTAARAFGKKVLGMLAK